MTEPQKLQIAVAEQRLSRLTALTEDCRDPNGQMPKHTECSRVRNIVGKLSVLTVAYEDENSRMPLDFEVVDCPSMNSPRCPMHEMAEVIELSDRQAS